MVRVNPGRHPVETAKALETRHLDFAFETDPSRRHQRILDIDHALTIEYRLEQTLGASDLRRHNHQSTEGWD